MARKYKGIYPINIAEGLPDVEASIRMLEYQFASAYCLGERVVKVIHSCGANGHGGGRLKDDARFWGRNDARVGMLVKGEQFSLENPQVQYLIEKFPHVAEDEDLGKANPNITVFFIYSKK